MAKLHFFYSVMNAGKTTHLLQAAFNWKANGGNILLFTSAVDDRYGVGKIASRIGLEAEAVALRRDDDLEAIVRSEHCRNPVTSVLVDEVQFLTEEHIRQMTRIVDNLGIPVMAYGLKNNFRGELFSPAVGLLLALADKIQEIKQLCHCGAKATMILKYDPNGRAIRSGPIVEIGGEGRYVSVCRRHWIKGDVGPAIRGRLADQLVALAS